MSTQSKLSGLFYTSMSLGQLDALKVAAIYFDDVYVLTPISLINRDYFLGQYRMMVEELLSRYPSLTVTSDTKSVKPHEIKVFGSDRPIFHSGTRLHFPLETD